MTDSQIYAGTVGADLKIGTNVDLITDVASIAIEVRKPSGAIDAWPPTSIDDATPAACIINYRTVAGDLDESGTYRLQPVVTMTNGDIWPLGVTTWEIWARYEGI